MTRSHALPSAPLGAALTLALATGLYSLPARADVATDAVVAADGTMSRARHALDAARAKHDEATRTCLEPRVFSAVALAKRTYELRTAMASADVPERARLYGALDALAARRALLQSEIDACLGIVPVVVGKTKVTVIIDAAIAHPTQDLFESWALNDSMLAGALFLR